MTLSGSTTKRILVLIILLLACGIALPCRAMQQANANLIDALKDSRTALALELLDKGADVQAVDKEGMSPLMWAVVMQNMEVMKALLAHRANVNLKSSQGQTALMFCAMQHKTDTKCMKALLDAKADTRLKDNRGQTALFYAVQYEHPELTKLLLDRGADINARDDAEDTVLSRAVLDGDTATVQLLLERGANVHLKYEEYVIQKCPGPKPYKDAKIQPPKTVLYYAVNQTQPRIVKMLLQKGARVKGTFDEGNTLLMIAVIGAWNGFREEPDLDILRSLLEKGVAINARNDQGKTALQLARQNMDGPEVIALLQKAGAKE